MKIKSFIICAIAVLACACSDAPEELNKIDVDLINTLSRDGSVSTYTLTDFNVYAKDTTQMAYWNVLLPHEYGPVTKDFENELCFQDGYLIESVFKAGLSEGSSNAYFAWRAYCKFSGEKEDFKKFYIRRKMNYDESSKTMTFGDSRLEYKIEKFTSSRIRIKLTCTTGTTSDIWSSKYIITGWRQYVYEYTASEPIHFDSEDVMFFNSNKECYKYWVDTYRQKYGRYVNLSYYWYGNGSHPLLGIIDLDEVDAWIDSLDN